MTDLPVVKSSSFPVTDDAAVPLVPRSIVLVGLMGAGKTSVGKRLAARLGLPFHDADHEIEKAAAMTVEEIFQHHGEAVFRDGERRVIARLLREPPHVLATGGGAFIDPQTRGLVLSCAISVWLKVELEELMRRVQRKSNRPLLKQGDPLETMRRLMAERYPIYAEADVTVVTGEQPADVTVEQVIAAIGAHLADEPVGTVQP